MKGYGDEAMGGPMKQTTPRSATYTAVLIPAREGGYIVEFPALDGCITQGDSIHEVKEHARDALRGYLRALLAHDDSLPIDHGPRQRNRTHRVIRLRVRIASPIASEAEARNAAR
jgi:predicted RNase H-like HicB family nuclease